VKQIGLDSAIYRCSYVPGSHRRPKTGVAADEVVLMMPERGCRWPAEIERNGRRLLRALPASIVRRPELCRRDQDGVDMVILTFVVSATGCIGPQGAPSGAPRTTPWRAPSRIGAPYWQRSCWPGRCWGLRRVGGLIRGGFVFRRRSVGSRWGVAAGGSHRLGHMARDVVTVGTMTVIGSCVESVVVLTTSNASPIYVSQCPTRREPPFRHCSAAPTAPGRCGRGGPARAALRVAPAPTVALAMRAGDVGEGAVQVSCLRCLGRRGRSSACRALWRAMKASRTSRTVARSASSRKMVASKARRSAWSSGRRGSSPKTRASVVHESATARRRSAEREGSDPPASYLRSWDTLTPARSANATWVSS